MLVAAMTMPDPLTATLLQSGPYARPDAPYRLLEIHGPDAGDFLQRLCSQDVAGLADGRGAPAAFLDAKGKVQATCLVVRLGDSFWIETHVEQVDRLAERLERYHFTEKLAIARRATGPCHELVAAAADPGLCVDARRDGDRIVVGCRRRGVQFVRSHGGPSPSAAPGEPAPLSAELAECLRMAAGLVRVGVDTEPSTLALEADLDDHCSTTKGCYTGQEIVARIHTYGHVNRKLCLLHLPDGPEIVAREQLVEPDERIPVGRVMHAVPLPGHGLRVGLGYLPEEFQAPGTKLLLADGGQVTVVACGDPAAS